MSDVFIANRVVKFFRASASQCPTVWCHDQKELRVISVAESEGSHGERSKGTERSFDLDAEWAQIMIQDVMNQAVTTRDMTRDILPFQVVLRSDCILSNRLPHDHSIDAKSVLDALIKECAGSRQDRRTAVDLAIVRETFKAQGSHIRWIPHH